MLTSLPGGAVRLRGWDLLLIQQRFPGSAGGASPEQGWGRDRREAVLADKRKFPLLPVDTLLGRGPDKSSHSSLARTCSSFSPQHHNSTENSLADMTCLPSLGSGTSQFLTTLPCLSHGLSWVYLRLGEPFA